MGEEERGREKGRGFEKGNGKGVEERRRTVKLI